MLELLDKIHLWQTQGKQMALATITHVDGSSLRPAGSKMLISSTGDMEGSVSGGCVESAVIEEAMQVMQSQQPKQVRYGISDEDAWQVGLSCGGSVTIWIEPLDLENDFFKELLEAVKNKTCVARITNITTTKNQQYLLFSNGKTLKFCEEPLPESVHEAANNQLEKQETKTFLIPGMQSSEEYLIDVFPPPQKLIIIGAVHMAVTLIKLAKILGFHTILIDARSAFVKQERFENTADEIIIDWPADVLKRARLDESTYLALISHDEKQDIPALEVALKSKARYIGALGSRKTHQKRIEALKELGLSEEEIKRVHAPIGLSIGARGIEEIALSIMAQIIAAKHSMPLE